ncbi:MAG TPA: DUF402 domain-containing protein [Gaiellaceae bacterium]|nr:DUF402 domain-containing protein [Gaiellaceae bacterium]
MWNRGDTIVLRSLYAGRVRFAFAQTVVEEGDGLIVSSLRPGARGVTMGRDEHGRYLERWAGDIPPVPRVWERTSVLWLTPTDEPYALALFWDEGHDRFLGWYVNLQTPAVPTDIGLDTTDLALDVWVEPDGTWSWKDEADLAEGVELGIWSAAEAAKIRAIGERVIEAWPFPTGWENFRPDPAWAIPSLPDGWDRV